MATIVLQAAGAFLGGAFGAAGAAIGSAAGAIAGYLADRALIEGTSRREGPRLSGMQAFSAEEGAPLARVYGTARVSGVVIWATRFQETATTERQGFKGGRKVTTFSYSASAAFALCEGPIAGVRRIWADGRELDLERFDIRIHDGGETQLPDPLVEAKQGTGAAPAYRGTAYAVIDHFPLDDFGNRLPQFQFEVLRPVGGLNERIRAVALIPGSTEYGLHPAPVTRVLGPGETIALNRHALTGPSDLTASLDELQMLCPNLKHVGLVVTWFGDDLRAGHCTVRPGVTTDDGNGLSLPWQAGGLTRETAHKVSEHAGGAAYGGSPADATIIAAIGAIKARGLNVTLYPFVMMDVPAGNDLPDPYGGSGQPAYPWRGRITCHPGPGAEGSADATATARTQVEAFCGTAEAADFSAEGGMVTFLGDPADWGYRRFVLHMAHLAALAGGVDAFLIGSEMRGLTALRDQNDEFPFVEQLCDLAGEARIVLGSAAKISYGADWSEYFGHRPQDGSGDHFFHLDALWAHQDIDAVGIDNYMPLSDWRDADYGGGNPDGFDGPYDRARLKENIAGGEGFDWFYADEAARAARQRSPITDGAHAKPWVFRYKDLVAWWSNPHFSRKAGVELANPTSWTPRSKPIWFTELGCPAVDKGPNQPNVFPDAKSSEGLSPYFSSGGRSDLAMIRLLAAHFDHWLPSGPGFDAAANPVSDVYGGRMVDPERIYCWAWDARPYPAFPLRGDVWADGQSWLVGHWLNGRLEKVEAAELIAAMLADHGIAGFDARRADGTLHGLVLPAPTTARAALEPLVDLFGLSVAETAEGLLFATEGRDAAPAVEPGALVVPSSGPVMTRIREAEHVVPGAVEIGYRDALADHRQAVARAIVTGGEAGTLSRLDLPGSLEAGEADALAADLARRLASGREELEFALPPGERAVGPGGLIRLPGDPGMRTYLVTSVEEGLERRVAARMLARAAPFAHRVFLPPPPQAASAFREGPPACLLLDLPTGPAGGPPEDQFRAAIRVTPWTAQAAHVSPEETGFAPRAVFERPAVIGTLAAPAPAGREGLLDRHRALTVRLAGGQLASVSRAALLNGANAAAVKAQNGAWEVLQFEACEEIEPSLWRLTGLLRGQLGTGDALDAGAATGAAFVLLDGAVRPLGLSPHEIGLTLNWRIGPSSILAPQTSVEIEAAGGVRAGLPLSPVHLRARQAGDGAVTLSWVRRGRIGADSWEAAEIPLGEAFEAYNVWVSPPEGAPVRVATVIEPRYDYPAATRAADFPDPPAEIVFTVAQLSVTAGPGLPAEIRMPVA